MPSACTVTGCRSPTIARGYCRKHYQRWRKHGDPEKTPIDREGSGGCSAPGCAGKRYSKGLCKRCYERAYYARKKAVSKPRPPGSASAPSAPPDRCWAAGCDSPPGGNHGLCAAHERVAEAWNADLEEALVTCCFLGCGETIDPETFGWEFPVCPRHRGLVSLSIELEQWGVMADSVRYLECEDWISAKWVAAVLGTSRESRPYLTRVVGDTPLFRIVTATLGDLYPDFPFLAPQ